MQTRRWIATTALAAAFAAPALAGWQADLASQMRWDHNCDVTFISNVIERDVDDEPVVIAKVHCEDGRVFDAIQRRAYEDFDVNECTPNEQAC